MSFLSGKTNFKNAEPKPFGFDEKRTSTAEQARPVPWLVGEQRLGITFLTEAFNVRAQKVKKKLGKEKRVVGYNYYAGFAGLVCLGPVDKVKAIYFDDDLVWSGLLVRGVDGDDFVDITIPGHGEIRLYWGTSTQTIDPVLAALGVENENGIIQTHPAYRHQAYIRTDGLFLGYQRTTVYNIELVVAKHPSNFAWHDAAVDVEGDCNVVAAIADALTNPVYGLGLPESRLDQAAMNAVAEELAGEDLGLSPVVNRMQPFQQVLVQLLEYFDLYHTTTATGKFTLGMLREISCNDPNIVTLNEHDLLEEPRIEAAGYESTTNQLMLAYTNRENHYKEDGMPGRDLANWRITGNQTIENLSRPWITRPQIAQLVVDSVAKSKGLPPETGSMPIRKSSLGSLRQGSVFRFEYAHLGICNHICRITEITFPNPARPRVEIAWRLDRSKLNQQHAQPADYTPPAQIEFETSPAVDPLILELPYKEGLTEDFNHLGFLVPRPTVQTTSCNVYIESSPSSFDQVHSFSDFALYGTLSSDYPADTLTVDKIVGVTVDLTGVDTELDLLTLAEATGNEMLLVVNDEIISVFGRTLIGPNQYRLWAIRGRFDTIAAAHDSGDEVYLIPGDLEIYRTANQASTQVYKLEPVAFDTPLDLGDADEISVGITNRIKRPIRPINLKVGGVRNNPTFGAGEGVSITWTNTAKNRGAFWPLFDAGFTGSLPRTVLEFLDTSNVVVSTITLDAGIAATIWTNSELVAALGSEQDFKVRAYHKTGSFRSSHFDEITVTLI